MSDGYYFDPRIAESYDEHDVPSHTVVVDDIPFYVGLAKQAAAAGQSVLELGCGTGRVTIPIAREGIDVVGLDSSPAMLEVARRKAGEMANLRWVQADMAGFKLEQRFGLAIIPFRSFLLLLTVAEQKACLTAIHDHLLPGGRLALNFFNPDLAIVASWLGDRHGYWERDALTNPRHELWATREYSTAEQRIDERQAHVQLSDEGAIISRVEHNLRLRYVFRYEMEHLLALTGFEVVALYGWFDGRPFDADSQEMVWVARKT